MVTINYDAIDGNNAAIKIQGENLGTDNGVQVIGHRFINDTIGLITDTPAVDQTANSTQVALLKGMLRELIAIAAGSGGSSTPSYAENTAAAVSVGTTETVVATIDCRGYSRLSITVQNDGATDLNAFNTKIRTNSTFTFHFPEVAGGYDAGSSNTTGNATALIRKTNGTAPETLVAGGYSWIRLNVEGVESIEFTATVAVGTTDVNAWWIVE